MSTALCFVMLGFGQLSATSFSATELPYTERVCGVAWLDADGDGLLDMAVASSDSGVNAILVNKGGGIFDRVAALGDRSPSGVACGDYDNDGLVDVAIGNLGSRDNTIYHNTGAFLEALFLFPRSETYSLIWADCNNDGFIDLAAGTSEMETNRLYLNSGTDHFVEYERFGAEFGRGMSWADCDGDGDPDLALANGALRSDIVFENTGGTDFSPHPLLGAGERTSCAWGDYDNDGLLDLFTTGAHGVGELWRNSGDLAFTLARRIDAGAECAQVAWGDYNNDGRLDLAIAVNGVSRLYRNDGGGVFTEDYQLASGHAVALAWADYDDDGDLDLAVGYADGHPNLLYRNEVNNDDYARVWLRGRGKSGYSNTSAIGVKVSLLDQASTLQGYREISGGHGAYTSQDEMVAHFGAPAGDTFSVVINWPASGITDTIRNVVPPAKLHVVENRRPGAFALASPAKGAEVSRKPMLTWHRASDPDNDALTYTVWYGKDPTFVAYQEASGIADTTWTPPGLLDSATYWWRVKAVDSLGYGTWADEKDWYFSATAAGVSEESGERSEEIAGPSLTALQNPARGAVTLRYAVPAGKSATLDVFNAAGRAVRSYALPADGSRFVVHLAPGVYFLRLAAGRESISLKAVVIR